MHLAAQKKPQGVLVRGHAGCVINRLSLLLWSATPTCSRTLTFSRTITCLLNPHRWRAGREHLKWFQKLSHSKWLKSRPESGLDWQIFPKLARQRVLLNPKVSRKVDIGYLEKGIQTPMAQGRSTKIITMIKWIRTSGLSIKNSLFPGGGLRAGLFFFITLQPKVE